MPDRDQSRFAARPMDSGIDELIKTYSMISANNVKSTNLKCRQLKLLPRIMLGEKSRGYWSNMDD